MYNTIRRFLGLEEKALSCSTNLKTMVDNHIYKYPPKSKRVHKANSPTSDFMETSLVSIPEPSGMCNYVEGEVFRYKTYLCMIHESPKNLFMPTCEVLLFGYGLQKSTIIKVKLKDLRKVESERDVLSSVMSFMERYVVEDNHTLLTPLLRNGGLIHTVHAEYKYQ